jgi:hypothetical protein
MSSNPRSALVFFFPLNNDYSCLIFPYQMVLE